MKTAIVKRGKIKIDGVYYSKGETLTGADDIIEGLQAGGLVDNVYDVEPPSSAEDPDLVPEPDPEPESEPEPEPELEDEDPETESTEAAKMTLDPSDVVVQPAKAAKSTKKG
jgi:hypothetical protein